MSSSNWRYVAYLVRIYNLLSGFCLHFISTSVPVRNLFLNFWVELSSFKYFFFSEKPFSLSGTALHRSSMKPSDMSAVLGTGGKSPLILPTSGLFGNLSMVRWLEHVFLFFPCETEESSVFLCCLLRRQTVSGTSLLVLLLLFTAGVNYYCVVLWDDAVRSHRGLQGLSKYTMCVKLVLITSVYDYKNPDCACLQILRR